jgi:hypothetical protein
MVKITGLMLVGSLIALTSFSQNGYLDFIQNDNGIQWAAGYDQVMVITPKIRKFGIKQYMLNKLERQGCIDQYIVENREINKRPFCRADSGLILRNIKTAFNPYEYMSNWYSNGIPLMNSSPFFINEKQCNCYQALSANKFDVYQLKQVVYYKNAQLYIKNILVTPLCLQTINDTTEPRELIWNAGFSTCFNNLGKALTPSLKKQCVDLGNAKALYNFNYNIPNEQTDIEIFTTPKPIYFHHLFEDIQNRKITAVADDGNSIPPPKLWSYKNPPLLIPMYDEMGNILPYKEVFPEINLDSLCQFEINQHFYFDTVNNVLYSEVNHINVMRSVYTSVGLYLGLAHYFRIYFTKPALYRKPKGFRLLY